MRDQTRFFRPTLWLVALIASCLWTGPVQAAPLTGLGIRPASRPGVPRDRLQVRLSSGPVEWMTPGQAWHPVTPDMFLGEGDRVRTGANGMLILELPLEAGFVNVLPGSVLHLSELRQLPGFDGPQSDTLTLDKGKAFVRLRKFNRDRSRFRVQSPSGSAVVRGTEFVVGVDPQARTTIGVTQGWVSVSAEDKTVELHPQDVTTFAPGQPPSAPAKVTSEPIRLRRVIPQGQTVSVSGRATAGSSVLVNGMVATIDDKGVFTAQVPLSPETSALTIEALDPTGHVETLTVTATP